MMFISKKFYLSAKFYFIIIKKRILIKNQKFNDKICLFEYLIAPNLYN